MTILRRLILVTAILATGFVPHVLSAERATLITGLNVSALQPGEATVAVGIQIAEGFHAQSHTPSQPNFIPFQVSIDPQPGLTFGDPIYPPGEDHTYPALGTLNVYTGKVIVYIPVQVAADAPKGPAKVTGQLTFQICDDKTCFFPERPKFEIATEIVPAAQVVQPANQELFAGFNVAITPARVEWTALFAFSAAFLAGLLFNVMPCVLPVLPLKAIGFYEVSHHRRSRSFALGVVFSLGLISVFALLAVFVLILKSFSWGDLFTYGWFIWSISILLALMGIGLFGFFSVNLPVKVYSVTPRHDTFGGNFAWGALTAILATPCTAPFLPPVLLWATSQPTYLGVPAMLMVGVGMSFPYLVLSALPELARKMPRSGPWAELFKQMMGFLMIASAMYFAGGRLVHGPQFWWLVTAVIAVGCFYLVGRTSQLTKNPGPVAVSAFLAVLMLGGAVYWTARINGLLNPTRIASSNGAAASTSWVPYSTESFESARASGQVVLVKFTANWCGSCQYIEGTVFQDSTVWDALHARNVVTMKVDLSEDGAPGKDLLLKLNPAGGIPLTAIFAPGKSPLVLASVYDSDELLAALDQIAPPAQSAMAQ